MICLGAVIRGATSHYDYVCAEVSKGIANVSLNTDIPVMFGVLTTDTIEQAIERAGTKAGNKGFECAEGAIEMVNLSRELENNKLIDFIICQGYIESNDNMSVWLLTSVKG